VRAVIARRVTVHGRVQGVFFRDSAQDEAERLGVAGWVRNRDDGAVEGWFEGDEDAVKALIDWCHAGGPPRASVQEVDAEDVPPEGHDGFSIR
jgi:acylphosphatase